MSQQDFLFELGCEELPPKALTKLASSLHNSVAASFESLALKYHDSEWFATPRRLAIRFHQLDIAQADRMVERLGPAVAAAFDADGNPKPAALGFAKSCGVEIDQLERKDTGKGKRLAYQAEVKGQSTGELIQDIIEKAVNQLPVPKAMRWGDSASQFSRPVHWIVAIQGDSILPVELFEVKAGNHTFGHRFHAPQAISLNSASDYEATLDEAKVVCCFEARKAQIRIQVEEAAKKIGAIAVVDEELLEEVACLVEWPVALMGKFDDEFLGVPAEALISSMAEHQKYFHLVDNDGNLLPRFITIANIESSRPESVIEGNEKVIRPRLADAKFFYDTDSKKKLEDYIEKLKTIVFQNKLGTLFDKTERVRKLAKVIAHSLGYDQELADRAAQLCKCDLMTDMVYEFPDLQGIMGRYYATNDGEQSDVAAAMDEIYMPRFAGDELPSSETGLVLALAERLDTLVGIFGIGQIPTGAKDPFALRRAALGVIRLISEKQLELDLSTLIEGAINAYQNVELEANTQHKLLEFFAARELALYQSLGIPTQVINSVQSINVTQPTDFKSRIDAVESFNKTDGSADLAEANKRVKNILEKSDFDADSIAINEALFESEETSLFNKINSVESFVETQVKEGNYQKALDELAGLKDVVNNFFDKVMINAEDPAIRNNRLALITKLRNLFLGIADISLLQK